MITDNVSAHCGYLMLAAVNIMKKNQIQPIPKQGYKFTGWAIFNWGHSLDKVFRTRRDAMNKCAEFSGEPWDKCKKYMKVVKVECSVV